MQQHLVLPIVSNEGSDDPDAPNIIEQLTDSVLQQGHLCPVPLQAQPVYWELDHTLRLFPLPHLLVLADHAEQYKYEKAVNIDDPTDNCQVVNPGSFSSDYSFIVYQPATKSCEFSRVI